MNPDRRSRKPDSDALGMIAVIVVSALVVIACVAAAMWLIP